MNIHIIEIEKGSLYNVNDKEVYKDANNNWMQRQELTAFERQMFMAFLRIRKV